MAASPPSTGDPEKGVEGGLASNRPSNEQTSMEELRLDVDPDIVDWDGPDDPENPRNWPQFKKTYHVAAVSLLTLAA